MDVLHSRCCGLDVHKSSISACILLREAGRVQKHQRRFGAMTQELQELAEWLRQFGVSQVAMESSGVYWKPVWNILEGQFTCVKLANGSNRSCRDTSTITRYQETSIAYPCSGIGRSCSGGIPFADGASNAGSTGRVCWSWLSAGFLHRRRSIPFPTLASPPLIQDKNRMR
jgi:hypothetical protein